jgi:hypothetical protein
MSAHELARALLAGPDEKVLAKVWVDGAEQWVEIHGLRPVGGGYRGAWTMELINPAVGGVIVVMPDEKVEGGTAGVAPASDGSGLR